MEIEECDADENWKETCNQIPPQTFSVGAKCTTDSEDKQQDTATDLYSTKQSEQAQ